MTLVCEKHNIDLVVKDDDLTFHTQNLNIYDKHLQKTHWFITWYGIDGILETYLEKFCNILLMKFNSEKCDCKKKFKCSCIKYMVGNLEKGINTGKYHIHLLIAFSRSVKIQYKINNIFNNIYIEAVDIKNLDNILGYCSKQHTKVENTNSFFYGFIKPGIPMSIINVPKFSHRLLNNIYNIPEDFKLNIDFSINNVIEKIKKIISEFIDNIKLIYKNFVNIDLNSCEIFLNTNKSLNKKLIDELLLILKLLEK